MKGFLATVMLTKIPASNLTKAPIPIWIASMIFTA